MTKAERRKLGEFTAELGFAVRDFYGGKISELKFNAKNQSFNDVPTVTVFSKGKRIAVLELEETDEIAVLSAVTAFLMNEKEREE